MSTTLDPERVLTLTRLAESPANKTKAMAQELSPSERDWVEEYQTSVRAIVSALLAQQAVDTELGRFWVSASKPIAGRDPQTGGTLMITGRKTVRFLPSERLLEERIGAEGPPQATLRTWMEDEHPFLFLVKARDQRGDPIDGFGSAPVPTVTTPISATALYDGVAAMLANARRSSVAKLGRFRLTRVVGEDFAALLILFEASAELKNKLRE